MEWYQPILDIIMFLGWLGSNLASFLDFLTMPFLFVATFLTAFLSVFSSLPPAENLFLQNWQALTFLTAFPLWTALMAVVSALIVFIGSFAVIKLIKL